MYIFILLWREQTSHTIFNKAKNSQIITLSHTSIFALSYILCLHYTFQQFPVLCFISLPQLLFSLLYFHHLCSQERCLTCHPLNKCASFPMRRERESRHWFQERSGSQLHTWVTHLVSCGCGCGKETFVWRKQSSMQSDSGSFLSFLKPVGNALNDNPHYRCCDLTFCGLTNCTALPKTWPTELGHTNSCLHAC